ncbi:transmembrane amino acid transporter [Penicillium angulare]|uniref:Transmembrane amino acid transporter n=1 Tax=Penicillium angulare TaxID=116970 RepID=A0A9W9K920_9EURO|nr:transmembrane amino acid transporter [Penicillium angulare]
MASGGNMGIEPIADPRSNPITDDNIVEGKIMERQWGLEARVDSSVTFEEYEYWAQIERADEAERDRQYLEKRGPRTFMSTIKGRFSHGVTHEEKKERERAEGDQQVMGNDEKTTTTVRGSDLAVTEEDWKTAARALKTTSWGTIFFLITTDILGWSSCPYAFSTVGYGPGVALYVIFSVAAGISGWILWKVYLALDSSRYPILSYGDTFFRVFGKKSRHFINATQALQQFMTVAVLVLGSGQIIAQLSSGSICYIGCFAIFTAFGIIAGLIRGLQHVGWLANMSVWLNIVSFIIVMVAAARYPVDYGATIGSTRIKVQDAVATFAGAPPNQYQPAAVGFSGQLNGVNQMVYSWGGALLFVAFLAEMRNPMDFWKGLMLAQLFICVVYIFFGAFVYSFYGQYSAQVITTAVTPVSLQTVGNVFSLLTGAIACIMYFNIGMKTVYIEVFQEILNFPPITTKKGRWCWFALGPLYWILAFVVAASVPNLNGVSGIVGALLILNFTYTFPALLYVGYNCQIGAKLSGEGFNPATRETTRHDTGVKRWIRGYINRWYLNVPSTLYFACGLALSGMGSWAAIEALIEYFAGESSIATSWGCAVPVS